MIPILKGKYERFSYLKGGKTLVKFGDNSDIVIDSDTRAIPVQCRNLPEKKVIEFVPRGRNNRLPLDIIKNVVANVTVGSNIEHRNKIILGDGVVVYRQQTTDNGKPDKIQLNETDAPEVFQWMEDNDYNQVRDEIANDLSLFGEAFVKYMFDKQQKPMLARVKALETACSRVSKIDGKTYKSEWHAYSAEWQKGTPTDTIATPLLDRHAALLDLQTRMGTRPNEQGKLVCGKERTFVHRLMLNSPGRFYYARPYWWSVFASGWYDFSSAIPVYKKALIQNQVSVRFVVYIRQEFWAKLYRAQKLATDEEKAAARSNFLKDMEEFLAGEENAGKTFVSEFAYDKVKGYEEKDIIITQLDNKTMAGGEYIEDIEEVSNTICYAMGVHPSIIGASPGKSKTINGTEARELFLIEQALTRRYQQLTLQPLYFAKKMNNWPKDIHFEVQNCQLVTLDKGTGAVKNIGMPNDWN